MLTCAALRRCYQPSFATDVPCTADLQCPEAQFCDTSQWPPLRVKHLGSAGNSTFMIDYDNQLRPHGGAYDIGADEQY